MTMTSIPNDTPLITTSPGPQSLTRRSKSASTRTQTSLTSLAPTSPLTPFVTNTLLILHFVGWLLSFFAYLAYLFVYTSIFNIGIVVLQFLYFAFVGYTVVWIHWAVRRGSFYPDRFAIFLMLGVAFISTPMMLGVWSDQLALKQLPVIPECIISGLTIVGLVQLGHVWFFGRNIDAWNGAEFGSSNGES